MRLIWIAANKDDRDRHKFECPDCKTDFDILLFATHSNRRAMAEKSLSVSNIVPALKNAAVRRRCFVIQRRVRACLISHPNTSARPSKLRRQRFNSPNISR